MDQRVIIIIALMKENPRRELTLDEMAHHVRLSPWHLCHLFKAETGTSPTQYLKALRMDQAKFLLETTLLSVKEVMAQVGINDESHFVRAFKETYGLSPARHRAWHFETSKIISA